MQKICSICNKNMQQICRICISLCICIFCIYMHSPLCWCSSWHEHYFKATRTSNLLITWIVYVSLHCKENELYFVQIQVSLLVLGYLQHSRNQSQSRNAMLYVSVPDWMTAGWWWVPDEHHHIISSPVRKRAWIKFMDQCQLYLNIFLSGVYFMSSMYPTFASYQEWFQGESNLPDI